MTEQEWLNKTLSPTEQSFPRAKLQQRAVYHGWIKTAHVGTIQGYRTELVVERTEELEPTIHNLQNKPGPLEKTR